LNSVPRSEKRFRIIMLATLGALLAVVIIVFSTDGGYSGGAIGPTDAPPQMNTPDMSPGR